MTDLHKDHKILIIDDDENLSRLIERYLTGHAFEVRMHATGRDAVQCILDYQPDIVVLDLMLPEVDGLTICRDVRQVYTGPILMLTALSDEVDEVAGLETGADDYLAKPVRPRLLLARIRALLRRNEVSTEEQEKVARPIKIGELMVDGGAREARLNDSSLVLTTAEFDLLWLLASNAGKILSRDDINEELRGLEYDGFDRSIDLRVSRLRRKIGDNPKQPEMIKSVRGRGYMLVG